MPEPQPDHRSALSRFFREPLLHFLALAALLFAANELWVGERKDSIVIDRQTADYLIQQREDLELRTLSSEERDEAIAAYIEDEILYREAYRRGLDKGDSRMRRNLILKMRGLLVSDLERPTEEQLRNYYESNLDQYTRPPTLTLNHVFFRDATNATTSVLEALNLGKDPASVGDSFGAYGRVLPGYSVRELSGAFGPDVARFILELKDDEWHGPHESIHGFHFFRVVERHPARQVSFEDVETYLEAGWMMGQSRRLIEDEVERLKSGYEITIEDEPEEYP